MVEWKRTKRTMDIRKKQKLKRGFIILAGTLLLVGIPTTSFCYWQYKTEQKHSDATFLSFSQLQMERKNDKNQLKDNETKTEEKIISMGSIFMGNQSGLTNEIKNNSAKNKTSVDSVPKTVSLKSKTTKGKQTKTTKEKQAKTTKEKQAKGTIKAKQKENTSKNQVKTKKQVKEKEIVWTSAGEEYFDDALFIGDSRTQGLALYAGFKNATFYTEKGLDVKNIFKDKAVKINGKKMTIVEALGKKSFKKVYIMLGVNELGWYYGDVFIDDYKKLIAEVKKTQPDATIYIQSIIHVTKEKSDKDKIYNNKNVNKRNKLIKAMVEEEDIYYIDVNKAVSDKTGALVAEAATDGIHLNKKYCEKWKKYLMEHVIKE